jgi:glycerophosphoryl diester phosphodiesterase
MPQRHPSVVITLRSAWWRFVSLWKPMAAWTLLVWVLLGLLLGPLASGIVSRLVFRGDRIIVGNVEIAAWLVSAEGLAYMVVVGALAIIGAVFRYAGLFRIISDAVTDRHVSVRATLFELIPDLPALFRLCATSVALVVLLIAPLAAGLGGIYLLWLGQFDINYYLVVRPPEWYRALVAAGIWGVVWATGALYVVVHSLPLLPAYLDGHRPVRIALRESWKQTRGRAARVLWLLIAAVVIWIAVRSAAHAVLFFLGALAMATVATAFSSLIPLVATATAYAAALLALDIALSFIGFSFASTLLTKFYFEDTDLHAIAPPVVIGLRRLPVRVAAYVRLWLRPMRALPVLAALILLSGFFTSWQIVRLAEPPTFSVIAHRAGALLAPENTLAALERAIEAGADYAEIDVQRTRDSAVVVIHDADLMRLAGDPRRIASTDYADIADIVLGEEDQGPPEERRLAALDAFLERARDRIQLIIELKYYGPDRLLAPLVIDLVHAREMADQVKIMSMEMEAVLQVRRLDPDIPVGYVAAVAVGDLARLPVHFLALSDRLATTGMIRAAHRRNTSVYAWTLNRPDLIVDAAERGADGVITDDPVMALRVRSELARLTIGERLLLRFGRVLTVPGEEPVFDEKAASR